MISVIMCTHNGSKTIDDAIISILKQTFENFEFFICDDGSIDNTYEHILNFANRDKRIIPIRNNKNIGLQRSLNKCIDFCSGEYIARMDDDDISKGDRFEKQINFLKNNHNISFVGSNINLMDNLNIVYGENLFIKFPNSMELFKRDEFCHPAIMISTDVLKSNGGYSNDKKFYRIEDHELWLRLYYLGYKGANISEKLLNYRLNINSKNNKFYDYFNRFRLLLRYKNKFNMGVINYYYVFIPLLKIMIPSFIRNIIYIYKYSKK